MLLVQTTFQYEVRMSAAAWEIATQARLEAGELWTHLVKLHRFHRVRRWEWPSEARLKGHLKGRYGLHSQSAQALIERFCARIDGVTTARRNGDANQRYPWRFKKFFNVIWKKSAIRWDGNWIVLSNGRGRAPLRLRLPHNVPREKVVQAELAYGRLLLVIDHAGVKKEKGRQRKPKEVAPELSEFPLGKIGAIDLGEIHAAVITNGDEALAVVGRGLRSIKQGLNKRLAELSSLQASCVKHSRRWRRLQAAKRKASRQAENRVRNLLHHAANHIVGFAVTHELKALVVGDGVANIHHGKGGKGRRSRRRNQAGAASMLGKLTEYVTYKAKREGIHTFARSEAYTSQTCPQCGQRKKPSGRRYTCTACGFTGARDLVGAMNILNLALNESIKPGVLVPRGEPKYLRPTRLRAGRSSPPGTGQVARSTPQRPITHPGVTART